VVAPGAEHPDGSVLIGAEWLPPKGGDLWGLVTMTLPEPEEEPTILLDPPGMQTYPEFSPDGRWFAYLSNEDQVWTIFLRRYPDTGAKWTVTGGNVFYMFDWQEDGSAILVNDDSGTYRVPIRLGEESPHIGKPEPLGPDGLTPRMQVQNLGSFTPDGKKLYTLAPDRGADEEDRIVLVTGWVKELESLAPQ
jgi:Tol biopolymer transport system component